MKRFLTLGIAVTFYFTFFASMVLAEKKPAPGKTKFMTADWVDLLPKADLEALSNPPSYIEDAEEGSLADRINSQLQNKKATPPDDAYQRALVSTRVVKALDGLPIRIPGFIVPLEFDDNLTITQFFLVPFFGACVHLPPPPPNQIILVQYPKGMKLDNLVDPFWVSGVLRTTLVENEMATAAYTMKMDSFEAYSDYPTE